MEAPGLSTELSTDSVDNSVVWFLGVMAWLKRRGSSGTL